jgi:hypothetical protein
MTKRVLMKTIVGLILASLVASAAVGPASAMRDFHFVKKIDKATAN